MIRFVDAFEPEVWTVVFHRKSSRRWIDWLAFGEFKHVSAFAYLAGIRAWLVYDVQHSGTQLVVIPDCDTAISLLDRMYGDCLQVRMRRGEGGPGGARLGFFCVPAVKHLLRIRSSALRCNALLRHLLANGGEVTHGARPYRIAAGPADRPGHGEAARAG